MIHAVIPVLLLERLSAYAITAMSDVAQASMPHAIITVSSKANYSDHRPCSSHYSTPQSQYKSASQYAAVMSHPLIWFANTIMQWQQQWPKVALTASIKDNNQVLSMLVSTAYIFAPKLLCISSLNRRTYNKKIK